MEKIVFARCGVVIVGYVLGRDSDPRAAIWVVDANNADVDYMVYANEIVGA